LKHVLFLNLESNSRKTIHMQALKKSFISILIIITFLLLGVISGFWVGIRMENPRIITSWEALNNPVKIMEIVNVSYAEGAIAAKGVDGKLYYLGCIDQICHQWDEVSTLLDGYQKQQELPIKKLKSCPQNDPPDGNLPAEEPPGIIVECVFQYTRSGLGFTGTYIALLEDGKVWRWHPQNTATDFPIFSLIIGPSLGLLMGLFMGVFFVRRYLLFQEKKMIKV
jgi:uncharacterized protein YneF (UPF0154 family)